MVEIKFIKNFNLIKIFFVYTIDKKLFFCFVRFITNTLSKNIKLEIPTKLRKALIIEALAFIISIDPDPVVLVVFMNLFLT